MSSITYVSAFYDIGREKWKKFPRSFNQYLNGFRPFINLFSRPHNEISCYNMVVFIDKRHAEKLRQELLPHTKITVIETSPEFLYNNLPMWRTLETERGIMDSPRFKNIVAHRKLCPECYIPEYTLINHCKIDYVCYLIDNGMQYDISPSNFYCWVDFASFQLPEKIPERMLDHTKLDSNRINYTLINPITPDDQNIILTMTNAHEKIGGFFFYGNAHIIKQYQSLYHEVLKYYQTVLGLADDDQALALSCYFIRPDMFAMHYTGKWHEALNYFQK